MLLGIADAVDRSAGRCGGDLPAEAAPELSNLGRKYHGSGMNPRLSCLQPYPFERLRALLSGAVLPPLPPVRLSIGEPQHATPDLVRSALVASLAGLSTYPATAGLDALREAMAAWFTRRFGLPRLDPATQVLPVNGTREALFAFAQAVVDPSRPSPVVVCPNPFYQIYEGAALLAGAEPAFLNQTAAPRLRSRSGVADRRRVAPDAAGLRLLAGEPHGARARPRWLADAVRVRRPLWLRHRVRRVLFGDLSGRSRAAARCARGGARALGRDGFRNLVVFTSLSKRSNAPGLRSGGDRRRCGAAEAISAVSHISWMRDEPPRAARQHRGVARRSARARQPGAVPRQVRRRRCRCSSRCSTSAVPMPASICGPACRAATTRRSRAGCSRATHVTVLPGRYLAREAHGENPGAGYVRIALVPGIEDCVEAARRIVEFCR